MPHNKTVKFYENLIKTGKIQEAPALPAIQDDSMVIDEAPLVDEAPLAILDEEPGGEDDGCESEEGFKELPAPAPAAAPAAEPAAEKKVAVGGPSSFLWWGKFTFYHVVRGDEEQWEIRCPFHRDGQTRCRKTIGFTDSSKDLVTLCAKQWCLSGRHYHLRNNHVHREPVPVMCSKSHAELDLECETALQDPSWLIEPFKD